VFLLTCMAFLMYNVHGVRQEGVLSLCSCAVYRDELSDHLGSAKVGCTVGNMVVNHLRFANDICVFSPNISGLQRLLDICGDYAAEHEIALHCNKTIGILFGHRIMDNLLHEFFSERCTCTIFSPNKIPWYVAKCLTEA